MHPFLRHAASCQKEIVALLREMVECESPSNEPKAVDRFVDLLIESGADIDIVDPWGKTALIHAVEDRHVNMVEHLLQRGCDPHIKYVNQAGSVEAIMDVFDIAPASNNRRLINVLDKYRSRV